MMSRSGRTPEERKFISHLMRDGARARAEGLLDGALRKASKSIRGIGPEEILLKALANARPLLEVRKKCVDRETFHVPVPVPSRRGDALAICGIIEAARRERGRPMIDQLAKAIVGAYLGTLDLPNRRDVRKMDDPPDPKRPRASRLSACAAYGTPG